MRDIIRCGLAMIVCFLALAGLYVTLGAPMVAAAQVIVYIGAISVLILFAIMLTQDKAAPSRLVFQTQAAPAAVAAIILAVLVAVAAYGTDWGAVGELVGVATDDIAHLLFEQVRPGVRGGQRAAARRGDRRRVPRQARAGRLMGLADQLNTYLTLSGIAVRDRHVRVPRPPERDLDAHVDRADAQRGESRHRGVRRVRPDLQGDGAVIALMVMAVAAAEATVGLAIVIAIFRNRKTPLVDEYDAMRR